MLTALVDLATPRPESRAHLDWVDSSGSHSVEIDAPRTVGSAPQCEIVLADKAVSRLHLELAPSEAGLWVRDLGSRNGTYVHGVKIVEARVPTGTSIRVGTTDITISYATTEAPRPPGSGTLASFGALSARSASMRAVLTRASTLARTDRSIVLEGEAGTGKKALARAIHDASSRALGPFVVVECEGLPRRSAELTDALEDTIASAEGGTLVLDAPAELSLAVQRELLPPLEAEAFRVLVSTQRDLRKLVNEGAFRERLYFHVAGATLRLPPLRERIEDLSSLLTRFLGPKDSALATAELITDLERLPWLGNVRELAIYADQLRSGDLLDELRDESDRDARRRRHQASAEADLSATVEAETIATILGDEPPTAELGTMMPIALEPWFLVGFKEFREKWIDLGEREYLRRLMARTSRSSSAASREAGLERTYLYRLLKKHGV